MDCDSNDKRDMLCQCFVEVVTESESKSQGVSYIHFTSYHVISITYEILNNHNVPLAFDLLSFNFFSRLLLPVSLLFSWLLSLSDTLWIHHIK